MLSLVSFHVLPPTTTESQRRSIQQVCTELWPSTLSEQAFFIVVNLVLCYLIPLCVISFCYIIIWKSVANRNIPGEYLGHKSTRDAINKSRLKVTKMVFGKTSFISSCIECENVECRMLSACDGISCLEDTLSTVDEKSSSSASTKAIKFHGYFFIVRDSCRHQLFSSFFLLNILVVCLYNRRQTHQ